MFNFQRCFLRLFHCRIRRRETDVVVGRGHIMAHDLKPLPMVGARAAFWLQLGDQRSFKARDGTARHARDHSRTHR